MISDKINAFSALTEQRRILRERYLHLSPADKESNNGKDLMDEIIKVDGDLRQLESQVPRNYSDRWVADKLNQDDYRNPPELLNAISKIVMLIGFMFLFGSVQGQRDSFPIYKDTTLSDTIAWIQWDDVMPEKEISVPLPYIFPDDYTFPGEIITPSDDNDTLGIGEGEISAIEKEEYQISDTGDYDYIRLITNEFDWIKYNYPDLMIDSTETSIYCVDKNGIVKRTEALRVTKEYVRDLEIKKGERRFSPHGYGPHYQKFYIKKKNKWIEADPNQCFEFSSINNFNQE